MNITCRASRLRRAIHHLRPVQLYGRLWFNLFRLQLDLVRATRLRKISINCERPPSKISSLIGVGTFFFLNEKGSLAVNGWDDPQKSKLWRCNQHYFDDLNAKDAVTVTICKRRLL